MCVCMYVYCIYIYIYIYTHTQIRTCIVYTQVIYYTYMCTRVIRFRALQACLGWCIHEYELTCTCMHTLIRGSATAKTCKGSSSKPFCASRNSQQKKVVFLTATWNSQICVWARCVFIQLKESSIMLLFLSSGHSHCHSICIWPLKGLLQTFSKTVQKLWTFECRNKKKFAP